MQSGSASTHVSCCKRLWTMIAFFRSRAAIGSGLDAFVRGESSCFSTNGRGGGGGDEEPFRDVSSLALESWSASKDEEKEEEKEEAEEEAGVSTAVGERRPRGNTSSRPGWRSTLRKAHDGDESGGRTSCVVETMVSKSVLPFAEAQE